MGRTSPPRGSLALFQPLGSLLLHHVSYLLVFNKYRKLLCIFTIVHGVLQACTGALVPAHRYDTFPVLIITLSVLLGLMAALLSPDTTTEQVWSPKFGFCSLGVPALLFLFRKPLLLHLVG